MEEINRILFNSLQNFQDPDGVTLEKIKAVKEPHGHLNACSYHASSSGMMYNSNSILSISRFIIDSEQRMTFVNKPAFTFTTSMVCKGYSFCYIESG